MQSGEQSGAAVAAAGPTAGVGKAGESGGGAGSDSAEAGEREGEPPNFDRIPAVERMLLVFLYSVASALVGTQSVLMAKCTSQIMRLQLSGESQWSSPFAMYIIAVFGLTATFWMTRLNRGLRLFPSTFIVPMMQAMWTVLSILNGGIFFKEFENFDTQRTLVFFSGVLVVLLSVLSLASGQADDADTGCSGDSERDMLLGGNRTRSRSSSGAKSSSFMFSLPCVPFLMSAQAVDLGTGDSDRWEALNRERLEAINRTTGDGDDGAICTLNAHGRYGFPGRHRRSSNTDGASGTGGGGNNNANNTPSNADSSATSNSKGGNGRGMLSWAWRVAESPRRRSDTSTDQSAAEQSQLQDDVDAFFLAEGA